MKEIHFQAQIKMPVSVFKIGRNKLKRALLAGILIMLSGLVLLVVSGVRKKNYPLMVSEGLKKADVHINNFSFFQTQGQKREWELTAGKAELFESEKKALLENVDIVIHGESGVQIAFHGDAGIIDTDRKNFHVQNNTFPMTIKMSNGYEIELMMADWDNEKKELHSDSLIKIHGGSWDIRGTGFVYKARTQEFIVKRDIVAQSGFLSESR